MIKLRPLAVPYPPVTVFWLVVGLAVVAGQWMRFISADQVTLNPALAFSLPAPTWLIYGTTVFFLGLMIWLFYQYRQTGPLWAIGLGLIVGGGLSNLIDRLVLSGNVADYWPWLTISSFNLPDLMIVVGIMIAARQQLLLLWRRQK